MKQKIALSTFILSFSILIFTGCSSSSSPSTPDKCVVQYYEYIIKNDLRFKDLMAVRFVGGTEKEREKMNAEYDERIKEKNGNLSAVVFPFYEPLKSVELVLNDKGGAYYKTESRLLPEAEAAEVTVKLTFADGETKEKEHIAVKVDGKWMLY
ncbi:hypothetical protein [Bacteroides sp. 224]|uniref:hypothetical protein n=1 Tax=Bacteroides sp. 224 TaxID=2302936 RepID=UPI0013D328AF|nr:hypothetical protein [Bacteroides sp. 224]NDV66944.1 hypothetical protein [Bacteroides sp. 224]